jgi:signal transduction histidine kinase
MLVGMVLLSVLHYQREQQLLDEQTHQFGIQLGDIISSSLQHSMLENNRAMLAQTLAEVDKLETISRLQIINSEGEIRLDTAGISVGDLRQPTDSGCVECHQYASSQRPHSVTLDLIPGTLRIATPIINNEKCQSCHDASISQLGVLFVDYPLIVLEEHISDDLRVEIFIMVASVLLGAVFFYLLLYWFVVRRVEKFDTYLESYADGDFSVRMPAPNREKDELDKLILTFNHMANELEQRSQDEHETQRLRQQAVREERVRIARDLHDGMAQLIGFVQAKASAIRLLLKKDQTNHAITNLTQLEEAAKNLSIDVRESILGLKTSEQVGSGLVSLLHNYVDQFRRLSDAQVSISIPPKIEDIPFSAETELYILRIVQEALSNARKHANATTISLLVVKENGSLHLVVEDNGIGFDSEMVYDDNTLHFGLSSMRDRTQEIGGSFEIDSKLGAGTRVIITLPLVEQEIL